MPKLNKPRQVFIGVDPGKAGGLVAIWPEGTTATPMPATEKDIWDWFRMLWVTDYSAVAVIEKVHAMPKQGVTSSFTFGMGYGGLRMCLISAGIRFEAVTPQAWMKGLSIPPRKKGGGTDVQWKDKLRARAQELFPELDCWDWLIGEQRKVSDALLIAEYCRRKFGW